MNAPAKGSLARSRRAQQRTAQSVAYVILIAGAAAIMIPFVWMLVTSLKEKDQIFTRKLEWLPMRQVRWTVSGREFPVYSVQPGGQRVLLLERLRAGKARIAPVTAEPEPPDVRAEADLDSTRIADEEQLTPVRALGAKWSNYQEALTPPNFRFLLYLRNTLSITGIALVGQVISCSLVAFGFARLRFPGRGPLFIVLLSTMMLPAQVTMVPLFKIMVSLGWYDTFLPLTVPAYFATSGFFVFLLRQYFLGIPMEMDEAARIDGATSWQVFSRVILPQVKPAVATVAIFSFMGHWNDFLGPLIYLGDPDKRTLALGLYAFQGEHAVELHLLMAAATVVMLPLLALFAAAQRYFIQGVVISGVKG